MAIAIDTFVDGGQSSPSATLTFSVTVAAGSNRALLLAVRYQDDSGGPLDLGTAQWNGTQTFTNIKTHYVTSGHSGKNQYFLYLPAPATGTHNVTIAQGTHTGEGYIKCWAWSLTGCADTADQPVTSFDAETLSNTGSISVSSQSSTSPNWIFGIVDNNGSGTPYTATGSWSVRGTNSNGSGAFDTNGALSTGSSYSFGANLSTSAQAMLTGVQIKEGVQVTTSISAIDGVAQASITSFLGVSNANMASANGVANS